MVVGGGVGGVARGECSTSHTLYIGVYKGGTDFISQEIIRKIMSGL